MKILKFGGKSLANGLGFESVINIIADKQLKGDSFHVVVSARGKATDELLKLAQSAKLNKDYSKELENFIEEQSRYTTDNVLKHELRAIENTLKGISLVKNISPITEAELLGQGELLSAKTLVYALRKNGIDSSFIDSRKLIKTSKINGEESVDLEISKQNVIDCFEKLDSGFIGVITGFISSNLSNETTNLGRNGSNYSAALIASFLSAEKVENFTHVDGVFSANPDWVNQAQVIRELNFQEANELANFGTSILHPKTILPLLTQEIPLEIRNTFKYPQSGTVISKNKQTNGIKVISVQENVGIVEVSGTGFFGQSGIDGRIFNALAKYDISVGLISQGSSERGISLLVDSNNIECAKEALDKEFFFEIQSNLVEPISYQKEVALISVIGQGIDYFHKPFQSLIHNGIQLLLINNTLNGNTIGLVVKKTDLKKSVNIIHSQIFGVDKVVNLAVIGKGTVGSVFLDQCIANAKTLKAKKQIDIRIFALSSSSKLLLNENGISHNWHNELKEAKDFSNEFHYKEIQTFIKKHHLENLILIDNTASAKFASSYSNWVNIGFNLVSSNKIANTLNIGDFKNLRSLLEKTKKTYLYETNVGAGLPLIDTIRLLHNSGENITKIRGVFSGSLSYIFNTFSNSNQKFGQILTNAVDKGFTEPDPREDLCGNDVARKLLILARELELENELEDVIVENLIPQSLREVDSKTFFKSLKEMDAIFDNIKTDQETGHVLRYIGELSGDLQKSKAKLKVSLISVPERSSLGQVQGSDSIIEIFTESYGNRPIVIQGAGAGAKVTARGVLGDVLRLAEKL